MKEKNGPVMLADYVKAKKKKGRIIRSICAAGLLLAAILLRLLLPGSARTVRAWVFGNGGMNRAVEAFYACAADNAPLKDALEALCIAIDGT